MFAPRTSDMCPDISFSSTVKHKSSDAFTNVEMGWRFPENAYRGQNRSSAGRNGEQHQPLSQRRNRSTFPNHTTWKVDRACHGSQQCKLRTCHAGCQRLDRHPNSKSTRSCLSISASRALGRLEEHRLRREETQRRNHRIVGIREAYPYQTVFLNRLQYDITSDWCLESTRAEYNAETDAFRGTLRLHTADTQDLENKKEGKRTRASANFNKTDPRVGGALRAEWKNLGLQDCCSRVLSTIFLGIMNQNGLQDICNSPTSTSSLPVYPKDTDNHKALLTRLRIYAYGCRYPSRLDVSLAIVTQVAEHNGRSKTGKRPMVSENIGSDSSRPQSKKTKMSEGDGPGSDDELSNRTCAKGENAAIPNSQQRFLACPYYKLDPIKYLNCFKRFHLKRIKDVKQHLNRKHTASELYCPTCWRTFVNRVERDRHVTSRTCSIEDQPPVNGDTMNPDQQKAIAKRDIGTHEAEQWYNIWRILFPGRDEPESPYLGTELQEVIRTVRQYWKANRQDIVSNILSSRQTNPEATTSTASLFENMKSAESINEFSKEVLLDTMNILLDHFEKETEKDTEPLERKHDYGLESHQEDAISYNPTCASDSARFELPATAPDPNSSEHHDGPNLSEMLEFESLDKGSLNLDDTTFGSNPFYGHLADSFLMPPTFSPSTYNFDHEFGDLLDADEDRGNGGIEENDA